jgi:hypothetical protein
MASLLAEAEQQGLIDVFLVMVTSTGFSAPHRQLGRSKADGFCGISEHQKTTVAHWRRLDGSETALEEETLDLENGDCILQVCSLWACAPKLSLPLMCYCRKGDVQHRLLLLFTCVPSFSQL